MCSMAGSLFCHIKTDYLKLLSYLVQRIVAKVFQLKYRDYIFRDIASNKVPFSIAIVAKILHFMFKYWP